MKARFHNYLGQSAARIFALAIPFGLTMAARAVFPDAQANAFFRLLADSVLITAFAKLGVDVYVARCATSNGRIVASGGYMLVFHLVSTLAMAVFLIWGRTEGGIFQTLGISALVVQAALLAEIARTRGWFMLFYLLKAPIVYIAVAVWVFVYLAHPIVTDVAVSILLVSLIALNLRFTKFDTSADIGWIRLFPATALSVLIVLFSWKESLLIDQYANDRALEIATFYTRFKLIITFFFTLHNARVPNLMREMGRDISAVELQSIMRGPRRMIWGTAAVSIFVGLVFAAVVDPAELLPATLMLSSCLILILFGNLVPVLNALDRQGALILAHGQAIVVFVLLTLFLMPLTSLLTSVATAAFVAQVTLGLHMWFILRRIIARKSGHILPWI